MEWWQRSVVVPVKRAWIVFSARLPPPLRRKKAYDGRGVLVKLHDDIQTCAYEDVQVMWEILQRSETARLPAPASAPPSPAGGLVWLGRGLPPPSRHRHRNTDLLRRRRRRAE